ncbi:MAG: hypothetical protein RI575_11355 [Balneolaceae bacterium]|nr:hypothetical protein [Balneolaceae bacterium]MDR9408023.1 hypothetical protein [Balneolaceae bacterium]
MKEFTLSTILIFFLINISLNAQSNVSQIEQVGDFHEAYVEQKADDGTTFNYTGNFPGKGDPQGKPFQNNDNSGFVDAESFAEISQFYSGNFASILQAGNHWAKIYQDGLDNIASVLQEGGGGGFSFNPPGVATPCPPPFSPCNASSDEGSVASIFQEGDHNTANIEQGNGRNEAKIVQYGSDLEAIIHQFGNNNYASILQDFRGVSAFNNLSVFRSAKITQTNDNNIATVEQYVPTENPIQIIQDGTGAPVHIEHY